MDCELASLACGTSWDACLAPACVDRVLEIANGSPGGEKMDSATSTFGLVERFKRGETEAFSLIFRKYRRRLAVLVHYKMSSELRGAVEVDDILQEVFLAAAQDMGNFTYQSPGSLMAWLSRISDHVVVDAVRYQNRGKRHAEDMLRFRSESNPAGPEPVDRETPSQVFARTENMQILLKKLDALPVEYREMILLAKFEGLTTKEISDRVKKSRESVALTLHRALKRFRELEALAQ
jgi:RNA polymerase sigma-70 factor (ECF subfamily)